MKTLSIITLSLLLFTACKKNATEDLQQNKVKAQPTFLTGTEWVDSSHGEWHRSFTEDTLYSVNINDGSRYVSFYTISSDSFLFFKGIYTIWKTGERTNQADYPGNTYKIFVNDKFYLGEKTGPSTYSKSIFWGNKVK